MLNYQGGVFPEPFFFWYILYGNYLVIGRETRSLPAVLEIFKKGGIGIQMLDSLSELFEFLGGEVLSREILIPGGLILKYPE